MTALDYLKAARRRWPVLVVAVLLAVVASWVRASRGSPQGSEPQVSYQASAIILSSELRGGIDNMETLATLVRVGEVPDRVAKRLGWDHPQALLARINVSADPITGLLTIAAASPDADEAKAIADGFARELLAFANIEWDRNVRAQLRSLAKERAAVEKEVASLEQRLQNPANSDREGLQTQLQSTRGRLLGIDATRDRLTSSLSEQGPQLVQEGHPVPVTEPAPTEASGERGLLLPAGIGLLLGMGLVLVVERFDPRLRSKDEAEAAFGLPVLTEIPELPRYRRRNAARILASAPFSVWADAYRLLAVSVLRGAVTLPQPSSGEERVPGSDADTQPSPMVGSGWSVPAGHSQDPNGGDGEQASVATLTSRQAATRIEEAGESGRRKVVMVVSAAPADGKTTVVANLASCFSEMGRKTLIFSWDFHRPTIHDVLGIPQTVAAASVAQGGPIASRILKSASDGLDVELLAIGYEPEHIQDVLNPKEARRIVVAAAEGADVVIIDTAPLLGVTDATVLIPHVDAVVVVGRAGRTTAHQAQQLSDLLLRLRVPTVGVALNAVREVTMWSQDRSLRRWWAEKKRRARSSAGKE